jgi:hypothetical protein
MSSPQEFTNKTKKNKNTSKVHSGPSKTLPIIQKKFSKKHKNLSNVLELGQSIN